jgi:alpha-beta hydrolase superfamily lysophospholipase
MIRSRSLAVMAILFGLVWCLSGSLGFSAEVNRQQFFVETEKEIKLLVVSKTPVKAGIGKAVLLVHGSGVGLEYWDIPIRDYSIMDYLAQKGVGVYAVECRGYGESSKPNGMQVNAASIASDLKSVIAAIAKRSGVSKVSLVGHSSGGTAVLVAAGTYPELLDRMVLMGTRYKKVNPQFVAYATKIIDAAKEPGKDYVANTHYLDVEKRLDTYDEDVVLWYKKLVAEKYGLMPGGIYPESVLNNPAEPFVSKMKVPTLILNGSREYVVDLEDNFAMFADLGTPDKAMILHPGGYHLMFVEKRGHVAIQEALYFWLSKK